MFEITKYQMQKTSPGDDSLYVVQQGGECWFCIADGAGGTGYGDVASGFVKAAFEGLVHINGISHPDDFESFLRKVDLELCGDQFGGETTAVVGKISSNSIIGASVGDSNAFLVNSEYEHMLTEMQYRKPLIGSGAAQPIGFGPITLDQALVVASDGLFNYANQKTIKRSIEAGDSVERIAHLARLQNTVFQDDISVILIRTTS